MSHPLILTSSFTQAEPESKGKEKDTAWVNKVIEKKKACQQNISIALLDNKKESPIIQFFFSVFFINIQININRRVVAAVEGSSAPQKPHSVEGEATTTALDTPITPTPDPPMPNGRAIPPPRPRRNNRDQLYQRFLMQWLARMWNLMASSSGR